MEPSALYPTSESTKARSAHLRGNRFDNLDPLLRDAPLPELALDVPAVLETEARKGDPHVDLMHGSDTHHARVHLGFESKAPEERRRSLLVVRPVAQPRRSCVDTLWTPPP